ncbi:MULTISPECIES: amidase [Rhizobium]|uniref:Amidase n=1 Tax=Rhizobium tropici TaxID=398 RepID=A0A6P1C834_RHITR|nr:MULTISPECIES: amidase [Rhizobium]AGB73859.1 glutamyl-tRNA(Gln) amidotransferase subunit A [Rhizobium tropici CIAT 899]MBB4244508.1 aspartyl-tRNA(Asn)/glutamyl-tRNA(Gln) amidotransferase subunit A [Rhizobium tropici]MBB5595710.1 aspartyl-tRNA(Asn)/glutamyl-tRNA(Gln) amidotransferase subunit A [Rhizobium tropici]MBB6494848.1 aspartyl-tRNA(Asn)/glutamyl-tRNA(Gln) amidotransferase subunit A [Rhizobium tropici]NEV12897.1 amidase [Rhizobium tropici]
MLIEEYPTLSAREIATRVSSGAVSALEILDAAFAALDKVEPEIHAFATLAREEAYATAAALDDRIARGEPVGALAGVPVAIKDLVLTKGIRTTFGSNLYADYIPDADDIVVERLRAADAIILGKTNVSEFGFGAHGNNLLFPATGNPWNTERSPGGSSAGSAAAVAAGVCPIAIGSDGGGSVRLPAALSGLVGIKAAMGRVPLWPGCRDISLPGVSGWESIEHIGPIARDVADAALMLSVIAGPDPRDRWSIPCADLDWTSIASLPRGAKVLYWPTWHDRAIEQALKAATDKAVALVAEACGLELVVGAPPGIDVHATFKAMVALETDLNGMRKLLTEKSLPVSKAVTDLLAESRPFEDATDAITARKAFVDEIAKVMSGCDFILTPTLSVTAFGKDQDGPAAIDGKPIAPYEWCPFTSPFNLTGQPAASVPCGLVNGLPVGLQIIGPHLGDAKVLSAAAAFEAVLPKLGRPPIHA